MSLAIPICPFAHVIRAFTFLVAAQASMEPASDDWTWLFRGENLAGWKASRGNGQFAVREGVIVGTSTSQTHFLHTTKTWDDFELELEVRLHDTDLNSGVQIRTQLTRVNDRGQTRPSIHGPQVDLGKSPGRSGHVFGQGNKGWITPKDQLISHKVMKNGEWNRVRIQAEGPRIRTWINDQPIGDVTDADAFQRYPRGVIALQVHGVKKSPEKPRHVSFRNIRIRPIPESPRKPQPAGPTAPSGD
ncbi:MAG: DUF1080 domain-containing protein [Planctomycetaceae bacterium]|nr:DUF1080 domain-containing protein [Planctomycetaceae bacterium]